MTLLKGVHHVNLQPIEVDGFRRIEQLGLVGEWDFM
jgi:hypothetical protein